MCALPGKESKTEQFLYNLRARSAASEHLGCFPDSGLTSLARISNLH